MITKVKMSSFGPIRELIWENLSGINLIIGPNGSGKSFFLKALYCTVKAIEEVGRGDERRGFSEILSDRLYWTFQQDKIGDIVNKAVGNLSLDLVVDGCSVKYEFGKEAAKNIRAMIPQDVRRNSNSIFLPAKEVLSIHHIIKKSREQDSVFGFDDTYLDLVRALEIKPQIGKNFKEFSNSRKKLESLLGGRVYYEHGESRWYFKEKRFKYSMGTTAEGVRKIAILDTLLGNRYITPSSIVFIDEPESALHPAALTQLLDIIHQLSLSGIQFFVASHSYFVIKKLLVLALKHGISIPVRSYCSNEWTDHDLREGMPDNSIVDESVSLYEQEVEVALK